MINFQPSIINAVLIGQNKASLLLDQTLQCSDIQTRVILHEGALHPQSDIKALENRIIVGAFSDNYDHDLKETLQNFKTEKMNDQTVIIEKKYQPLLSENLSNLQKSCLFAVPKLRQETLYETIVLAYEYSRQTLELQQDIRSRHSAIGLIRSGVFEVQTPKEARNLSTMLGLLCPNAELTGTGLFELIMNAIEHGNLNIGFESKIQLIKQGALASEVQRRLNEPEFRSRIAEIRFKEKPDRYLFHILDQGNGFNIRTIEKTSKGNLLAGRGIHIARTLCFHKLQYRMGGRLAIATLMKT